MDPTVDLGASVPSPDLIAAWLILGDLPTERVPFWAAHWLAAGYGGEALTELAGLSGRDPASVRDLVEAALLECGPLYIDVGAAERACRRAAAMTAFTAAARLMADGLATERWLVGKVYEIAEPWFDESVTSLPLGSLYLLEEEWDADWGRATEQLRSLVRRACREQLEAAFEAAPSR